MDPSARVSSLLQREYEMTIASNNIIRSKRKTLALIVKPDGSLLVRAPLRASKAVIEEFVQKNKEWIEKQQAKALATLPPAPRQYVPGETFLYLGTSYLLEIVEGQREQLLLNGTFKLAAFHHDSPRHLHLTQVQVSAAEWEGDAAKAFEHWYREQARRVLPERVELFARQYNFHYKGVRITSARTRWGSCSATGALSFSWRLILAPLPVVDYVVIHELVHTIFHNHSKQFWQKVKTILPDYQEHRKWLRDHGRQLLM
jgi:predicted metal-dependent hydrolase